MFSDFFHSGWTTGSATLAALGITLGALLVLWLLATLTGAVRYIPNDRIGVVEKLWSGSGSVKLGLLALGGEAGFQPDLRRGGFHFFTPLAVPRAHPADGVGDAGQDRLRVRA